MKYSLNKRLTLSLAASLALFFLLQTLMIGREVEFLSEQNLISRLKHDQEELLAAISWQPPALPKLNPARIQGIYQRPFSGHYYQINIANRSMRSRSLWDEQLPEQSSAVVRDAPGPSGQRLLVLSQRFTLHDQTVEIRIAEDISHIESTTALFQRHLLFFAAAAMLALLLMQGWIVRYGLKPLQRIRRQLGQLERGEIDQVTTPAPDEIKPLVEEINHLVQLINRRLVRSRHALGNLAHAIKTPLAVMGQIIQRQADSPDTTELKQQLHHIEHRIDRELARARTAGRSPGGNWAAPHRDLNDLGRMLRRIFPATHIALNIPENLSIAADREDMLEIFGNLLENACKWADSEVSCSIAEDHDNGLVIQVEDDGPGIASGEYQKLLMRGALADESRSGHGLGLAIVCEIITAYEGKIELGRSPKLCGLLVKITLRQP